MLIYDEDCGFCTACARWAQRRLPSGTRVVAWQQLADLSAFGCTVDDVSTAAYWIGPTGRAERGAHAVAAALVAIGGPWAVAGMALRVRPVSWAAAPVYRLVARYRYRLPGATAACRIPRE